MKKKGFVAMLIFCLLLAGGAWAQHGNFGTQKQDGSRQGADSSVDSEKIKLTIWLDEDNEYEMRQQILDYNLRRKSSVPMAPSEEEREKYFPDIQWELVRKNYLSPEQYRQELAEALEKGEGPDIIYMDTYNGVDPKGLMEAGALADLGDIAALWKEVKYVPGALEPGQQGGKDYVMPLYMECPLVFGLTEELEQAGIQTEEMYGSLEEFLDALLEAQEKTGKQVFEDDAAVDWLEQYYMPEDKAQAETLTGKLEQLRAHCGDGEGQLDAYRGLDGGSCLLGGSGIYDYKRLAANLSLFGKSRPVTLLGVPCSSGGMKGIITHAAAVNAASKHVEKAVTALCMFKKWTIPWAPDIPVLDTPLEDILRSQTADFQDIESVKALYEECSIPEKVNRAFLKHVRKGIGSMAYAQGFGGRHEDAEKTGERKKVVSIGYPDHGGDTDYPVTRWLEDAAAAYMQGHSDVYIQLVKENFEFYKMCQYGVAPDAVIWLRGLVEEKAGAVGDFSALAEGGSPALDALPDALKGGMLYGGKPVGLPVWAEEYGIWCSRKALDAAGLTENWRPKDAGEMAEGLRKLKQALALAPDAPAAVMDYDYPNFQAMALFLSKPQAGLLEQQGDGSFRCSKAGWVSYLSCLQEWGRENLAAFDGSDMEGQMALALAEGGLGAWIGSSSMSGWFDGTYGLRLSKEQQEDILFIPLSPAANMEMVSVSGTSENVEEVFSFWEEAVQSPGYAQAVRESCRIPVTELSGTVSQTLPMQEGQPLDRLQVEVWDMDKTAEELAEEYPWYEWTAE